MLQYMTRVPWATLSGQDMEDLAALLLFSEYPDGAQHITPSQGDGGMDVRIWTPDGWDVYQIKKFFKSLEAGQKAQVMDSFASFQAEVSSTGMNVKCWTLLMPWDPTREQRAWFDRETANDAFPTAWEGLTRLELLASHHPAAVDYFIGNGRERLSDLIMQAMRIGSSPLEVAPGVSFAAAALAKVVEVEDLLQRTDPYYRYTITIEPAPDFSNGHMAPAQPPGFAYAKYHGLDTIRCVVIRAFYRTEGIAHLRPIRTHFHLTPEEGSPQAAAVREFWEYGTRLEDIPGTVTVLDDPTGLADEGPGLISFIASVDTSLPDLEVRLLGEDGQVIHRIPLVNPVRSAGQVEGGYSFAAQDAAGAFTMVVKSNLISGRYGFHFTLNDLTGKTPMQVLSPLRFIRDLLPGNATVLGVQGAGELGNRVVVPAKVSLIAQRAADLMEFVKALLIFQQYSLIRVEIPPLADLTREQMNRIGTVADLLLGQVYSSDWYRISIKASGARMAAAQCSPSSAIVQTQPLVVDLGSYTIEFDIEEQYIFQRPTCPTPIEELNALPDDEIVELEPGKDGKLIHRLPVEHVPRMVEID
jgi:hypothetical protein